jgi:chromosome segregation ATPase
MLIARPEYFMAASSRNRWLTALQNKIQDSRETLTHLAQNEANKTAKITRLKTQIRLLETTEQQLQAQISQERAIHTDTMKRQDEWYHNLPPNDTNLKSILDNFAKEYLTLNKEKQNLVQENQQLKQNIEISNKILEAEQKEMVNKETQTDLTNQDYEQQHQENQKLKQRINQLENFTGKGYTSSHSEVYKDKKDHDK